MCSNLKEFMHIGQSRLYACMVNLSRVESRIAGSASPVVGGHDHVNGRVSWFWRGALRSFVPA
jgi:hypothetical protein